MTCTRSHQPSYNPKVPCPCGRGMKAKASLSCATCGREKWSALCAKRREEKASNTVKSVVSGERERGKPMTASATDWLSKPLRVSV